MTLPLRTSELTRIRAVNAAWLDQSATITRPDGGKTSDGFADATPTTVGTGLACRVEPAGKGGEERLAGAGVTSSSEWVVVFKHDAPVIQPRDTIVVTGVGTFQVTASTSGRGVQTDVVARCVRVDA